MVHGKPLTVIFSFALPLLVGNLFNQLYNVVDTAIVGRALGADALAAVGSTGNSTGNHLHLEVWRGGSKANAVNPRGYIPIR